MSKLTLSRAATSVFSLFAINGLVSIVGFLTQIALANNLGVEVYGFYAWYVAVGTYIGTVVRYGREKTLLRDLVRLPERFSKITASSIGLSFILFCASFFVFACYSMASYAAIRPAMFLLVWGNVLGFFDLQQVFDARLRMERHAIYNAVSRFIYYAIVWSVIVFKPFELTLELVGAAVFIGIASGIILQYREVIHREKLYFLDREVFSGVTTQAKSYFPMMLLSLLDLVYGPALILSLGYFCGKTESGIYNLASQFLLAGNLMMQQIARVGNPQLVEMLASSERSIEKRRNFIGFMVRYITIIESFTFLVAAPLIVCPKFIVDTIFRTEYSSSATVLPVFGVSLFFNALAWVAAQYVLAAKCDRMYFFGVVATNLCGLLGCVTLIPKHGISGAAYCGLLTAIVAVICNGTTIAIHHRRMK